MTAVAESAPPLEELQHTTAIPANTTKHLSELCKENDLSSVVAQLAYLHSRQSEQEDASVPVIDTQDSDGRTAFHWAIGLRSWDLARQLLAPPHNASAFTRDKDGTTPLMSACAVDAPTEILDLILQHTPKEGLEATDSAGNTALLLASSKGNVRAMRALLAAEANITAQNRRGQSALHRAVSRGMSDAVEEILVFLRKSAPEKKKVVVNFVDVEGNTALHYASIENNQELGQLLLRNGANREAKNKQGKAFYEL